MWNGKMKAFTLSYDDGVESDRKLIDIINSYGLKCTFNLNSGILGTDDNWDCNGFNVRRLPKEGIAQLYAGHEIAVHGYKHIATPEATLEEIRYEFEKDYHTLSEMFNTTPVGMAHAYGAYNDVVLAELRRLGIRYGRTVVDSLGFDLQDNLLEFRPTCHHSNEKVFDLIDEFLDTPSDKPQLFYLWGHAYEYDANNNWDRLVKICEKISGRDDVFYGTNREVFGF